MFSVHTYESLGFGPCFDLTNPAIYTISNCDELLPFTADMKAAMLDEVDRMTQMITGKYGCNRRLH